MNLAEHYNSLYEASIRGIKSGNCATDPLLDSTSDNRFGITLVIRPNAEVKDRIQSFLNDLRVIEPNQYYYPNTDIHVTLLSIISCRNGFDLSTVSVPDYVGVINKSLAAHKGRIDIEFKGSTASPSCVMVQGFLFDDAINELRDNLRANFRASDLQQTIDQRYAIQTAHATVVRFRHELTRKHEFVDVLERYRDFGFGLFSVDTIELVYNDWYQRHECVKGLHRFEMK